MTHFVAERSNDYPGLRSVFFSAAIGLLLTLLTLVTGCQPLDYADNRLSFELEPGSLYNGRLNSFLSLKDPQGPAVLLKVDKIEIMGDGLWLPLSTKPIKLDSSAIGAGQQFLGSQPLPPGRYTRLRLSVIDGEANASEPYDVEIDLEGEIILNAEESPSLLFTWDVENSVRVEDRLQPALSAALAIRPIMEDLVLASCPTIDTIFVIRADKNRVVDSFGVPGGPTYLAVDGGDSRQRLYVLTARDNRIKVVNLSSYRVVDFFPAPLNDIPTFMAYRGDRNEAFLLDEDDGYLTRLDLETGEILARVQLGYHPRFATYLTEQNLLAVSLALSQKVELLDPENLRSLKSISTGSSPQGLLLLDDELYIAESGDNSVSVVDLAGRANLRRFAVGFAPSRLLSANSQIYVSNYFDGSLSVLVPGQLGVMQGIYGLNRPMEMEFNPFYRRLYVTEGVNALAVVDVTSNLLLGHIVLGGRPFAMAGIQ